MIKRRENTFSMKNLLNTLFPKKKEKKFNVLKN